VGGEREREREGERRQRKESLRNNVTTQ